MPHPAARPPERNAQIWTDWPESAVDKQGIFAPANGFVKKSDESDSLPKPLVLKNCTTLIT